MPGLVAAQGGDLLTAKELAHQHCVGVKDLFERNPHLKKRMQENNLDEDGAFIKKGSQIWLGKVYKCPHKMSWAEVHKATGCTEKELQELNVDNPDCDKEEPREGDVVRLPA